MSKSYNGRITKWVWDGNVILHEWVEHFDDVNDDVTIPDNLQSEEAIATFLQAQLEGRPSNGPPETGELALPTTWLFDPDTFAPASKIVGDKYYSIITDHLGTPLSMYDEKGVQHLDDGTKSFVKTFDHCIGLNRFGKSVKQLLVHTDSNGWVKSAYPI